MNAEDAGLDDPDRELTDEEIAKAKKKAEKEAKAEKARKEEHEEIIAKEKTAAETAAK